MKYAERIMSATFLPALGISRAEITNIRAAHELLPCTAKESCEVENWLTSLLAQGVITPKECARWDALITSEAVV